MQTIEIDFQVYKALTARRETETVTYNDVIRGLLGFPTSTVEGVAAAPQVTAAGSGTPWIYKGVRFPEGTEFRATYQGALHRALVRNSQLEVNGQTSASPSDAARLITGTSVNGWTFWECRFPGQAQWRILKSLRTAAL